MGGRPESGVSVVGFGMIWMSLPIAGLLGVRVGSASRSVDGVWGTGAPRGLLGSLPWVGSREASFGRVASATRSPPTERSKSSTLMTDS